MAEADEADGTAEFAKAIEALTAQDQLAAEAAERRKEAVSALRDQYGEYARTVETATKRNQGFLRSLQDGTFARQAREMERLNREAARMAREGELRGRYGDRVGGFLARHDSTLRPLGQAAGYATAATLATGGGLVRQGFSGTVESARLNQEWHMLSRELAGAFKPVIDTTTRVVRGLRQFAEGLSPAGQNAVMFAGLALSAGATLRLLTGGGLVATGARALLTGGASLATTAIAATAATAGGSAAGTAVGGAAAGTAARGAGLTLRGAAKAVPYVGLAVAGTDAAVGGDYGRSRAAGKSKVGSYALSLGASLYDSYHMIAPWEKGPNPLDKARADWDKKHGTGESRRQVSISGGGFDEGGALYDRINVAVSRVEAERDSKPSDEEGSALLAKAAADLSKAAEDMRASAERRDGPALRRPSG